MAHMKKEVKGIREMLGEIYCPQWYRVLLCLTCLIESQQLSGKLKWMHGSADCV